MENLANTNNEVNGDRPPSAAHWLDMIIEAGVWAALSAGGKSMAGLLSRKVRNDTLELWHGREALAQIHGCDASTVSRQLAELFDFKVILRRRRFGTSSITALNTNVAEMRTSQKCDNCISGPKSQLSHSYTHRKNETSNVANVRRRMSQECDNRTKSNEPAKWNQRSGTSAHAIEEIYRAYPRKVGKAKALTAIRKALTDIERTRNGTGSAWLLERVQAFAASPAGQAGRFTPHPSTWFNAARYDDDPAEWHRDHRNANPRRGEDSEWSNP